MADETRRLNRRSFLAAAPALAATPLMADIEKQTLAVNGGTPVRATALASSFTGTQFYDEQEQTELMDALGSRSLNRWYGPGTPTKVAKFERELAAFMGARFALAVTSGTAALHCALTALNVGPGDEVILPAWAWHSCYNAILLTGALPVFAEVDESFTMDPEDLESKITPRTKAVMVVHLFGAPADMDRIMDVSRKHKLNVLEDAAQSVGAQYKGRRLASIGDIGIYSFQITKVVTAGEGGALVTGDPLLFERAVRFHDLGFLRPDHKALLGSARVPSFLGPNYRMNEMTGAVMRAQLRKLGNILERLRRNALFVKERIGDLPGLRLRQSNDADGEIGIWIFLMLAGKDVRDRFVTAMRAENVPASAPSGSVILPLLPYIENKVAPHTEWPSFLSPQGKSIRYGAESCPRTIRIFDRAAGIPIGPKYGENDLNDIVRAIRKVYRALIA